MCLYVSLIIGCCDAESCVATGSRTFKVVGKGDMTWLHHRCSVHDPGIRVVVPFPCSPSLGGRLWIVIATTCSCWYTSIRILACGRMELGSRLARIAVVTIPHEFAGCTCSCWYTSIRILACSRMELGSRLARIAIVTIPHEFAGCSIYGITENVRHVLQITSPALSSRSRPRHAFCVKGFNAGGGSRGAVGVKDESSGPAAPWSRRDGPVAQYC